MICRNCLTMLKPSGECPICGCMDSVDTFDNSGTTEENTNDSED